MKSIYFGVLYLLTLASPLSAQVIITGVDRWAEARGAYRFSGGLVAPYEIEDIGPFLSRPAPGGAAWSSGAPIERSFRWVVDPITRLVIRREQTSSVTNGAGAAAPSSFNVLLNVGATIANPSTGLALLSGTGTASFRAVFYIPFFTTANFNLAGHYDVDPNGSTARLTVRIAQIFPWPAPAPVVNIDHDLFPGSTAHIVSNVNTNLAIPGGIYVITVFAITGRNLGLGAGNSNVRVELTGTITPQAPVMMPPIAPEEEEFFVLLLSTINTDSMSEEGKDCDPEIDCQLEIEF